VGAGNAWAEAQRSTCSSGVRPAGVTPLELFEKVVNLVRQHAPDAAIAFNSSPEDTADAALRWLRLPQCRLAAVRVGRVV
jgi:hypothetical protein